MPKTKKQKFDFKMYGEININNMFLYILSFY